MDLFQKLNKLSEKRIDYFLSNHDDWFQWSKTYWEWIKDEIKEAENELNTNKVYLEDELWDILWDYLCLLNSLKKEGKIDSVEKVLERALKKYTWRINEETWKNNWNWEEIKARQKKERDLEIKGDFGDINR